MGHPLRGQYSRTSARDQDHGQPHPSRPFRRPPYREPAGPIIVRAALVHPQSNARAGAGGATRQMRPARSAPGLAAPIRDAPERIPAKAHRLAECRATTCELHLRATKIERRRPYPRLRLRRRSHRRARQYPAHQAAHQPSGPARVASAGKIAGTIDQSAPRSVFRDAPTYPLPFSSSLSIIKNQQALARADSVDFNATTARMSWQMDPPVS